MPDLSRLCSDLGDEHAALDEVVADLPDEDWDRPTPAPPWSVRDQISHLSFFDDQALLAATDPEAFGATLAEIAADVQGYMDAPLERGRAMAPSEVLASWRRSRAAMLEGFAALDPARRIPWYGPSMSPASFITARIMETWAHGQDILDSLGIAREPTDRLYHVAHLGVRARPFGFTVRGMTAPDVPIRVELNAPDGDTWAWDDAGVPDRVTGSALDFCLVVTQRRHIADTDLVVEGPAATAWMEVAQCFAGPPGEGRAPGQFSKAG